MKTTRNRKLILNTSCSLLLQFVTLISGFILPRLILSSFGSEVNGLVNSITQFLGIISLLDLGVGSVVESSFYKPLTDKNNDEISKIFVSATKFFKHLALIFLVYVTILMIVYPFAVNNNFGHIYTITLIGAIFISSFAQYYFGIVNSLILNADQRGYIQYTAQIVTIIINTAACYVLIKVGGSIQLVKLAASIIFLCRPLYLNWYVKKHYQININIKYTDEPIKQKWNGIAQHFAYYVLTGTDNIVLTLFSTLENVSIYSVYNLVVTGIKNALVSVSYGFKAVMGELLAKENIDKLKIFFSKVEWIIHTGTVLVFGCTGVLIVPFVKVYTNGVIDANYNQPLFALLITIANAGHCLRLPYNNLILAAGHYKQTQNNYIITTLLNIFISIATVKIWGLIGVAVGTLIAMFYQTIWMAWYDSKNIINTNMYDFIKQIIVDFLTVIVSTLLTFKISLTSLSYAAWILQAIAVFSIWLIVVIFINLIFYRNNFLFIITKIKWRQS